MWRFFAQYLDQKFGGISTRSTPISGPTRRHPRGQPLGHDVLGMQIMVEGLALAAFGFMHQTTEEPLLKKLLAT
ncbi:MAG: hypothetical protein CM1200mP26_20020 [Acidimicrobiales bacterium]|nr:MAG: hypothetical protein CM1200mP26_20020 [Acidimicrobiales bacterium]